VASKPGSGVLHVKSKDEITGGARQEGKTGGGRTQMKGPGGKEGKSMLGGGSDVGMGGKTGKSPKAGSTRSQNVRRGEKKSLNRERLIPQATNVWK